MKILLIAIFLNLSVAPSYATDDNSNQHYTLLKEYYDGYQPQSVTELLLLARSSWALGLVTQARNFWDLAYASKELEKEDKVKTLFSHAILELQEGRYDQARVVAEKALFENKDKALEGQLNMIIADALRQQFAYGVAETYYKKAVENLSGTYKYEAFLGLGIVQKEQAKIENARESFLQIPLSAHIASLALQELVEIDLVLENYSSVETWIQTGQKQFSREFNTDFIRYAMVMAKLKTDQIASAEQSFASWNEKSVEQSSWYLLAKAEFETAYARSTYLRASLSARGTRE